MQIMTERKLDLGEFIESTVKKRFSMITFNRVKCDDKVKI